MNGPCFLVRETAALAPIKYRYTREKGVSVCLSCVGGKYVKPKANNGEPLQASYDCTRVISEMIFAFSHLAMTFAWPSKTAGCNVHAAAATPQVPAGTRLNAGNMDAETSTFLPILIEPRSCSGAFNICRLPREKRDAKREFNRSRGDRRNIKSGSTIGTDTPAAIITTHHNPRSSFCPGKKNLF